MASMLTDSGDGSGFGGGGYGDGYGFGDSIATIAGFKAVYIRSFSILCMGCEAHTIQHWRKNAERIAKRYGGQR